ncbi:MAG: hypothetical protein KatS3mg084_0660 [Candidatus Dojkabacteria bacterium]|nr:MAG: hypothetical protein KatS3mg084_0660 [Candidatus Dojkabacteria bacterium]
MKKAMFIQFLIEKDFLTIGKNASGMQKKALFREAINNGQYKVESSDIMKNRNDKSL